MVLSLTGLVSHYCQAMVLSLTQTTLWGCLRSASVFCSFFNGSAVLSSGSNSAFVGIGLSTLRAVSFVFCSWISFGFSSVYTTGSGFSFLRPVSRIFHQYTTSSCMSSTPYQQHQPFRTIFGSLSPCKWLTQRTLIYLSVVFAGKRVFSCHGGGCVTLKDFRLHLVDWYPPFYVGAKTHWLCVTSSLPREFKQTPEPLDYIWQEGIRVPFLLAVGNGAVVSWNLTLIFGCL